MKKAKLWILPNFLGEENTKFFPEVLQEILASLDGLVAESEKNARRFLAAFLSADVWKKIPIYLLNEHYPSFDEYIPMLLSGKVLGLISDAGMPCIADPGSAFIFATQKNNISVEVVSGYSSIYLSLILSGLDGNRFSFQGYLPKKEEELLETLKNLEKKSLSEKSTQIWIETPYRVGKMFDFCLKVLHPNTYLCVAQNLLCANQRVITKKIALWMEKNLKTEKANSVFLLRANK